MDLFQLLLIGIMSSPSTGEKMGGSEKFRPFPNVTNLSSPGRWTSSPALSPEVFGNSTNEAFELESMHYECCAPRMSFVKVCRMDWCEQRLEVWRLAERLLEETMSVIKPQLEPQP